jgi:hypothetical protein
MLAALFASHLKPRVVQRLVGQTCATLRWASYSTTHDRWSNGSKSLSDVDNEVAELISDEAARQRLGLELIASEVQALQALHYKHYNYKHYTTSITLQALHYKHYNYKHYNYKHYNYKHYNYKHYNYKHYTTSTTLASCANGHYNS